jgi:hypothetical protein
MTIFIATLTIVLATIVIPLAGYDAAAEQRRTNRRI